MPFKGNAWTQEKIDKIKKLSLEGKTLKEIGIIFGVKKQRIKQIMNKHKLRSSGEVHGKKVQTAKKRKQYIQKWGYPPEENYLRKEDWFKKRRTFLKQKKNNASKIGKKWDIEFSDLEFPDVCPILGIPLTYSSDRRKENSASIDRLNSQKDYTRGNVFVISWRANRIKNDGTAEEHRKIANYIDDRKTEGEKDLGQERT